MRLPLNWLGVLVKSTLGVLLLLPVMVSGVLYAWQDHLIFPGREITPEQLAWTRSAFPGSEIRIAAGDSVTLHGWYVPSPLGDPAPLLIYFGGNAEEVSNVLRHYPQFREWSLLLVNYRGFGLSDGEPSQQALFADAERIYDWGLSRPGVDPDQVVVWGRSLGSGVAVYLASRRPVTALILTTPYDSVATVAKQRYPFVPVDWLLHHPFDSLSRAPSIDVPVLAVAAEKDRVIPLAHTLSLLAVWSGPKELRVLEGTNHIDIHSAPDYWRLLDSYLGRLLHGPEGGDSLVSQNGGEKLRSH